MAADLSNDDRPRADEARDAMATFWLLTAGVAGMDAVASFALGWGVPWHLLEGLAAADLALAAPLALRRYRHDARLASMLEAAAALVTFTGLAALLSYLVTATVAPLVDAPLAAADRAFGFDPAALLSVLRRHRLLALALDVAYASGLVQLAVIVLALAAGERRAHLAGFLRGFAVATVVAIAVSAWLPAAGPWFHLGTGTPAQLASLSHFEMLREGAMQAFPVSQPQGLISMPSMHAAAAVLFVHAMRGTRWLAPFAVLDALMLASTPMSGGHYLVDVIAGVALAALVVAAGRRSPVEVRPRAAPGLSVNFVQEPAR